MAAPKNPLGAKSDKIWREAVMRAVKRESEGKGSPHQLEKLADMLVATGLTGDVSALKEIGDRLDGKPVQMLASDPDNPLPQSADLRASIVAEVQELLGRATASVH